MSARARVLMDPGTASLQRLQQADTGRPAASGAERVASGYASSLASLRLRDFGRADASLDRAREALKATPDAATRRSIDRLAVEIALAAGRPDDARNRARALANDDSRVALLMRSQIAMAGNDRAALTESTQALQTWVAGHGHDATAWAALSQCAAALGLRLRSIRADAEAHAAIGDLGGAIDRLVAGQRTTRHDAAGVDFIEASVIDARLRILRSQQRSLIADARDRQRRGGGEPGPDEEPR
jgi:predicted Zn-dependent protease